MPRATNKTELIQSANDNFDKMWIMIESLTTQQQEQNFTYNKEELTAKDDAFHWKRDNNLRDVLTHLYEWHQLLLNWVKNNMEGRAKPFLPEGITWTNFQKMNVGFFEKHQNTPYDKSKQMVKDSHEQVIALIEKLTNEELFEKKHFNWTGTTNIGAYCISATASHYDWAMKKLKAYHKALTK